MSGPHFGEALQAFIDASVDGGGWARALTLAERATGARAVMLHGVDSFGSAVTTAVDASAGLSSDIIDEYARHYVELDVRLAARDSYAIGAAVCDETIGEVKALDRTPIYADFYRKYDIGRFIGVRLAGERSAEGVERNLFLTLLRDNKAAEPTADQSAQAITLAHVARGALRSAAAFAALRAENEAQSAALNQAPFGVFMLGPGARIHEMNAAGSAILARGDGLRAQRGRLVLADVDAQTAIESVCGVASADGKLLRQRVFGVRGAGGAHYGLMVTPLRRDVGAWLLSEPGVSAVLFVTDARRGVGDPSSLWRAVFGLSAAEAEVARLMADGLSQHEIAVARGVGHNTVHTQIRRIYDKLDARSQGQAAATLARVSALRWGE